jgi:MFS transporter, DHA2 family, multidrug resistance protein
MTAAIQSKPKLATNPYIGIVGVFLGATLATMNARLISVGLPDLRGALGLGFDQASWLPTALNMAMMFSGCFVVFVSAALFGPRRILIPASLVFALTSALLPFAHGFGGMLTLMVMAGLTSGTFYSLTMTFVLNSLPKKLIIFGVAAYAADIVFTANVAPALEAWYTAHLSWHWIYWNSAVLAPFMALCVYFGIPKVQLPAQRPSWRGFTYFSLGLSLVYGALDQGERLYWLHSGIIVGMLSAGVILVLASWLRRLVQPLPVLDLAFLSKRNIVVIGLSIFVFKFAQLATLVLVPSFLENIHDYRPLQVGDALAWVALPMFATVWIVAIVVIFTNSRLILALGLTLAAVACWRYSHIDTSWAGNSFELWELLLSVGFACSYVGLVGSIVLEAVQGGAMTSLAKAATISGYAHFIRLFGGEVGATFMGHFLSAREKFHSNLLGLHVQSGTWITDQRLHLLAAGAFGKSSGTQQAQYRAADILGAQIRAQAFTLATSDGFVLIAWAVVVYLMMMLLLRPIAISYRALSRMP